MTVSSAPAQSVSFRDPPVIEVAFSMQFTAGVIDLELLGEIAGHAKAAFPRREQHPPIPAMNEEFNVRVAVPQLIFQTAPGLPRTWFVNPDGSRLVQVQSDRLGYNWRRDGLSQGEYPRYNGLRQELINQVLPIAERVVTSVPTARINVVELSYINELRAGEAAPRGLHPPLNRFLRSVGSFDGEFLPQPEDARLQARWRIPGDAGVPVGRLYAAAEPAFSNRDETPIYVLNLTARLLAGHSGPSDAVALLDTAHEWIVRGFKDLTTDEMHKIWSLEEDT
jgi:uncharacterized protein (TIGR04255 family)